MKKIAAACFLISVSALVLAGIADGPDPTTYQPIKWKHETLRVADPGLLARGVPKTPTAKTLMCEAGCNQRTPAGGCFLFEAYYVESTDTCWCVWCCRDCKRNYK